MNSYYPFACEFISLSGPLVKPKGGAVRQSSRKTALPAEEEGEEEGEEEEDEEEEKETQSKRRWCIEI